MDLDHLEEIEALQTARAEAIAAEKKGVSPVCDAELELAELKVSMNIIKQNDIEPAKATGSMVSPLYVWMRMFGSNELISETALTIFLKLGMKLGDNKGKRIARPDF